jgi:hypothetical protein
VEGWRGRWVDGWRGRWVGDLHQQIHYQYSASTHPQLITSNLA